MANNYIAVENERLDIIVKKVLGNLDDFEDVLKNNPHLQDKIFLDYGDVVDFEIVVKKDFSIKIEDPGTEENNLTGNISEESIQIEFIQPLINNNEEENLKALW